MSAMNKNYKSEKDFFIALIIWAPTLLLFLIAIARIFTFSDSLKIIPAHFIVFGSILFFNFSAIVWFLTDYKIRNSILTIRFGLFRIYHMKIDNIIEIKKVIFSKRAPALSKKQILLKSKTGFEIAISPKNEKDFINQLMKINPNINLAIA